MIDPYEIVTTAFAEDNFSAEHAAETALTNLHDEGWHIVRLSTCECGGDLAESHPHDDDAHWPTDLYIVEEWKP